MNDSPEVVDTRIRIPRELYERIKLLAQRQRRSINSQMVVLLERATKQAEKGHDEAGDSPPALLAA